MAQPAQQPVRRFAQSWRFTVDWPAASTGTDRSCPEVCTVSAAVPASVYRLPGFLAFLIARIVVVFAVQIQAVVVAWQVYDLTRDPLSLAYVGLAQFIPMLVLLMPAGDLIDRYDRKLILMLSWLVEGVCAAALLWLSLSEAAVSWYYAVLVLYGCGRAFTGPALSSLLPQIVPRERLAAAIAANSMIMRGATISGPVIGGGLYAIGGGGLTYSVCLACFLAGCVLLLRVPVRYAEKCRHWKPLPGRASPPASTLSARARSSSAPSRWTCSRCCSAA